MTDDEFESIKRELAEAIMKRLRLNQLYETKQYTIEARILDDQLHETVRKYGTEGGRLVEEIARLRDELRECHGA